MSKHPGLRRRGNVFIIGRAVPKDLRGKGPYVTKTGKPRNEIVRSLDTTDFKQATRKVYEEWVKFDQEFEIERFKLGRPELRDSEINSRLKALDRAGLRSVEVSEIDVEEHASRYFVQLEKKSEEDIPDLIASLSQGELDEIVQDWRLDEEALRGIGNSALPDDGSSYSISYFEDRGILLNPDSKGLNKLSNLFRRARLENIVRNIERVSGNPPKGEDALFGDLNGLTRNSFPQPSNGSD